MCIQHDEQGWLVAGDCEIVTAGNEEDETLGMTPPPIFILFLLLRLYHQLLLKYINTVLPFIHLHLLHQHNSLYI